MSLFEADFLRAKFIHKLDILKETYNQASKLGLTECCNSGVCCWRRPGALNLEDVSRIAAFKGLNEKELFNKYLVVDTLHSQILLLPIRKHQAHLAGTFLDWRETYNIESPCVFLGPDNKCEIHEVKPFQCRIYKCWEDQKEEDFIIKDDMKQKAIELGWDGNQ